MKLGGAVLPASRIYSFIDKSSQYTLHFIEGQKLIHDLAIIHDLKGQGFAYFRDSILSSIPLVTMLKAKENLGLYIDSKDPYFLLKIEMNELGFFRTLLLPDSFDDFPKTLKGEGRLSRINFKMNTPYTSIIQIDGLNFREVVNGILKDSYQINGRIQCSEESDQSVFLMQLPYESDQSDYENEKNNFEAKLESLQADITKIFKMGTTEEKKIIEFFEEKEFNFLTYKDIDFKCSCSYERMVSGIEGLLRSTPIDEIFHDDDSIETKCDYCKTYYQIPKSEFLKN